MRHLNNGTDHRHSKSCCDQSTPARRTIISVHLAHIFNCWTLVAPKVSLSTCCDYGWLACTLYRATATHAVATRYPVTSWPTIPRDTGLQHSCAIRAHRQAPEQQLRTRPVGHWTRVQDSRTVASTVTRTQILLWWNIFYVPVDEHIQRSYTLTSKFAFMAYWSNWQTLWITLFVFLYVHFCKWNLCRDFMCECIKMLLRPVDCAIICPKRRSLCSITVS